ncbi:MAG: tripartite tricarboxylate transporter substrate binding protein [Hyphomicrobiaceae bacterium]|nr:tripartite tricarboxylate transporter substrate binding protein [Hyphomicrobiaceae bacterium]
MTKITRRTMVGGAAATGMGLAMPHIARAQGYPGTQTIKIVVPYPAGGSTDIVGRTVADALATLWKTTVVVENVAGAGANVGMDRVAKGPADGTTLLVIPPNITTNQFLYQKMLFDPEKDIVPICQVSSLSNLLTTKKDLKFASVKDFITHLKANPGKINFASSGIGTTIHLSAEMFKRMAGVDMVHVAYRGSAPALNDLVGGQVDVMFDNLPSVYPHVKAGTLNGIAVTAAKKVSFAPEFPTVAETVPGFDVQSWFGIGVRSGTSAEIIKKIETDIIAICKQADVRERLARASMETVGSAQPEFIKWVDIERKRWGQLITDLKITAQ